MCVRCAAGFLVVPDGLDGGVAAATRHYGHFELLMGEDDRPLELGRGAMGTTYRARDTVLNRHVAPKVIEQSVAKHPAARERFLREARVAAKFQHPNVAAVSHYGEQEGECFYAMELVEGETLEARVRREGPLPVVLTLTIAIQVTKALVAAEARGIIHRDLKPTNLMLAAPEGDTENVPLVKLIDFGLAKAVTVAADGEGASSAEKSAIDVPPTNDLVAYDLYLRAVADLVYSVVQEDFIQRNNRRLALLKQALERDPKFTLAYCAIAGAEDELFFQHKGTTPEG